MKRKRILVIEDAASHRQLYKTALEGAGYEVLEAPDGQAGVRLYRQQPCDVVITDIFMPQQDGLETIFELKTQYENMRVIAISGGGVWGQYGRSLGSNEALDMAARFGADRVVHKPIKLHHLITLVQELLKTEDQQVAEMQETAFPANQRPTKKRVLIIEDDERERRLFTTALKQAGYEVIEASNGEDGVRLLN